MFARFEFVDLIYLLARACVCVMASSSTNARATIPVATSVTWQVKFPKGWQDLPPDASSEIESAHQRGANVADYKQCRSKKRNEWVAYQLDFRTMRQTNVESERVREARRIVDNVEMRESYEVPVEEPIDSIFNEQHSALLPIEDLPRDTAVWLSQGGSEDGKPVRNKIPKTDAVGIL